MDVNKQSKPFYVPDVFKEGESVFLMSATHRGDMYHLRAALQLTKFSVVLYNSKHPATEGLEDYLTQLVVKKGNNIFVVPWAWDGLRAEDDSKGKDGPKGKGVPKGKDGSTSKNVPKGKDGSTSKNVSKSQDGSTSKDSLKDNNGNLPTDFTKCFLNGKEYDGTGILKRELKTYSESEATKIISEAPNSLTEVAKGMVDVGQISEGFNTKLLAAFTEIWKNAGIKPPKLHEPKNHAILFQYRDTGTSDAMGVYPELDTGNAIKEIRDIVDKFPKHGNDKLQIISCGLKVAPQNASSPKGELGIGEYWKHIPKLPHGEKSSARDVEAYFLKWSYDEGYYKMASGLRSGPVDLFTFLDIPTVSIGLRNLKGEGRHGMLAHEKFKRVNIQYDQPRHNTTACMLSRNSRYPIIYTSPFWGDEQEVKAPDEKVARGTPTDQEKKDQQTKAPEPFHKFDKRVIEIGYRIACHQYMGLSESVFGILKSQVPGAPEDDKASVSHVDTRFARSCYISGENKDSKNHLEIIKLLDLGDVNAMESKLGKLQQTAAMFETYKNEFDEDWEKIEGRPKPAKAPLKPAKVPPKRR